MKKIPWILFTLILILLMLSLFSCSKKELSPVTAPDFSLQDLEGKTISLSDYRGKVVFLNFWATWCAPCKAEIPGLVEMYEKYREKGMEIIGVSVDRLGAKPLISFAQEYRINYPVIIATQRLVDDYRPGRFIPVTVIIDKEGKIRKKHIGFMSKETIENYFLQLQGEGDTK
ncbi:MAG: TlpA disulfide reductase family protein [Candidatus Aminicenantales bacterium]